MTPAEVSEWLNYHDSLFDGYAAWVRDKGRVLGRTIAKALDAISLDDAKAASDELFGGDEEPPKGYTHHIRRIRSLAFRLARRRRAERRNAVKRTPLVDGEPRYSCLKCLDDGLVSVLSPASLRLAKSNSLHLEPFINRYRKTVQPESQLTSIACYCDCEIGRATRDDSCVPWPMLGEREDLIQCEWFPTRADFDKLVALAEQRVTRPAGYHDEFAQGAW